MKHFRTFVLGLVAIAVVAFGLGSAIFEPAHAPDKAASASPSVLKDRYSIKTANVAPAAERSAFEAAVGHSNVPDVAVVRISKEKRPPAPVRTFAYRSENPALNASIRQKYTRIYRIAAVKPPDYDRFASPVNNGFNRETAFKGFGFSNYARAKI